MMNFKSYRFDEITINFDKKRIPLSAAQRKKRHGIYRYYGAQGVIDYIDDYIFDGTFLLIAEDGENLKSQKQNIAQIATGKFWVNNHAHIVQGTELCDTRFLCYLLNSMDLSGYVTGSAQPKLSQKSLNAVMLSIPDISIQRKIVDYLYTLDKKIKNNIDINENLEEQARTVFKDWFIDYTPFDDPLVTTPAGFKAPTSLKITRIADIPHILETGRRPKGGAVTNGIPSIGAENVKELGKVNFSSVKFIPLDFAAKLKTGYVNGYELMIYKDGGKPGTFIPHFSMFGEGFPYESFYINEHVFKLDFYDRGYNEFAYFYMQSDYPYHWLASNGGKAAVPGINQQDINSIWIFSPENPKVREFSEFVQPLFTHILQNCKQNVELANLRNQLLPKLMSGEIDLSTLDF